MINCMHNGWYSKNITNKSGGPQTRPDHLVYRQEETLPNAEAFVVESYANFPKTLIQVFRILGSRYRA